MRHTTPGQPPSTPSGDPAPARPRLAADLAERLGRIMTDFTAVAGQLAELALTPATPQQTRAQDGPEPMWTPKQIADAWGVGADTVLDWIRDGELNAVRVGQRWHVPDSECVRFMHDQIRVAAALRAA